MWNNLPGFTVESIESYETEKGDKKMCNLKRIVLLIALILAVSGGVLYGCAGSGDGMEKSIQVPAAPPVEKTLYNDNTGIAAKEEPAAYRLVYGGYIYPVRRLDGWDIRDLSQKTYTQMKILEGNETPRRFELVRGQVSLTFIGQGDERTMTYRVFKDGKELEMDYSPHKYRGMGPFIELDAFLESLEIKHYTDEATKLVYIDSDKPTEILGEKMYSGEISLAPGDRYEAEVDYDYVKPGGPEYEKITFSLKGKNNFNIILFDQANPGNSKSYENVQVNQVQYEGNDFIQVVLNAQGRSNGDMVVFKYADGKLGPVFTKADYSRFMNTADIMLETDENGGCSFVDKLNGIKKEVGYKDLTPNSIFPVRRFWFNAPQYVQADNSLVIAATADSVYNGSLFFEISFQFKYNGTAFIPVKAEALDSKKFIEDKNSGKSIEPLSKYKIFEYDMNAEMELPRLVEHGTVTFRSGDSRREGKLSGLH